MNVLIGETAPGGAGGGAGAGGAGAAGAQASAATAQFDNNESTTKEEHWVEFEFVDKAGLPVSGVAYEFKDPDGNVDEGRLRLDGTVRRDALSEGQAEVVLKDVYGAEWGKKEARPGEKVTITGKAEGFEDGTPTSIQVIKRDFNCPDVVVDELKAEVQGEKVEAKWIFEHDKKTKYNRESSDQRLSSDRVRAKFKKPTYLAEVSVKGHPQSSRTGPLEIKSTLTIGLETAAGEGVADEPYIVCFSNGEVRKGTLDSEGRAQLEDVPPCRHEVMWPRRTDVQRRHATKQ
jgi:hypothetical protein